MVSVSATLTLRPLVSVSTTLTLRPRVSVSTTLTLRPRLVAEVVDNDDNEFLFRHPLKMIECAKAYETKCGLSADVISKLNALRKRFTSSEGHCAGR